LSITDVWIVGEGILGRVILQDEIRHESKPVLERLNRDGITTMILNGENAVGVHESSTVLFFLNSLRLLFLKDDELLN
jgi:cation transport ATPase